MYIFLVGLALKGNLTFLYAHFPTWEIYCYAAKFSLSMCPNVGKEKNPKTWVQSYYMMNVFQLEPMWEMKEKNRGKKKHMKLI